MGNTERPLPSAPREETPVQRQTIAAVAVLEQAAMALLEGTLDDELRRQAAREADKLAGSVGTFGFTEGARLAREMEHMLQAGVVLEQMHALRLSELVVALLKELERPVPLSSPLARVPTVRDTFVDREDTRPLLLVVDDAPRSNHIALLPCLARHTAPDTTGRGREQHVAP